MPRRTNQQSLEDRSGGLSDGAVLDVKLTITKGILSPVESLGPDYNNPEQNRRFAASLNKASGLENTARSQNPHDNAERDKLCVFCLGKAYEESKCSRCVNGRYCSKQCRTLDRHFHNKVCGHVEQRPGSARPSPNHHLMAGFSPSRKQIGFTWVYAEHRMSARRGKGNKGAAKTPAIHFKFESEDIVKWAEDCFHQFVIDYHVLQRPGRGPQSVNFALEQGILLISLCKPHRNKPEDINPAHLDLGKPGQLCPYFGPIFIVPFYNHAGTLHFSHFDNITLPDLRLALVDLVDVSSKDFVQPAWFSVRHAKPALKASNLADSWIQAYGVTQKVEPVFICRQQYDPKQPQSFIAKAVLLGLRWRTRIISTPVEAERPLPYWNPEDDPMAAFLDQVFYPPRPSSSREEDTALRVAFTTKKRTWRSAAIIYHEYGYIIHPHHLLAAAEFSSSASPQDMKPANFKKFWLEVYRPREVALGNVPHNVPSPHAYEVIPPPNPESDLEQFFNSILKRTKITVEDLK